MGGHRWKDRPGMVVHPPGLRYRRRLTALLVSIGVVGVVIAAVVGTAAVLFMFVVSRRSHVGHHNAVEVEEAGHAVRFRKKKKSRKTTPSEDVQR